MLTLIIQQHRPPRTRFTVKYENIWAAFNSFAEVKDFLHDIELDNLDEYFDLTEDPLQVEIDAEYIRLTEHLRSA
tara:strand:- start:8832 stop:9056 length:225 start_codon:yes stop_codon:yes gene_type:complete